MSLRAVPAWAVVAVVFVGGRECDQRLPELLFRYRARNWPGTLSEDEAERWEAYRLKRLEDPRGGGSITLEQYGEQIASLREQRPDDEQAQQLLDVLEAWGGYLA